MPTSSREKRTSLADKAYQKLVTRITRLELEPGAVLAEQTLVAELEIGRTPVREALQRLAMEGLVQHILNRGMFVSAITHTDVQQIYDFRQLIECFACKLAAEQATTKQRLRLQELHQSLVQSINGDDIDSYVEFDREFHQVLADASQNKFLIETSPRIFNLHLRLWFYISSQAGGWHSIAWKHEEMTREVTEAINEHDSQRASEAMRTYIIERKRDILQRG